ncbi:MAG: alpha/beta hydrolase [Anaerolineaceae bacterium]|nr:alpha/beta hydrolase [Anaerolineaceae bacterium]
MISSTKLHHRVIGNGIPMVLLHGFPLDHTIWYPVVDILAAAGIQVILPDLRGHGLSPSPEGVYTMNLMAEDILNLLEDLGIEKAVLVGHSMGGYVSLAFSCLYPNRLSGLALVSTQASADTPEKRQSRLNMVQEVKRYGVKALCGTMPLKLTNNEVIQQKIIEIICRTTPQGIIGALKGMAYRPDFAGRLPSISVPTVVVGGLLDAIIPMESFKLMSQLLCKAWLVEIKEAGHMPMMETPEPVAGALCELAQRVFI